MYSATQNVRHTAAFGAISKWVCALLIALSATSAQAVVRTEASAGAGWDSVQDALIAVRDRVAEQPSYIDREYVGAVVQRPDGRYYYTWGAGEHGHDEVQFSIGLRAGEKVLAFWHTHGTPGWGREFFSRRDAELVREMDTPLYLLAPSGQIKVLTPDEANRAPDNLKPLGSVRSVRAWAGVNIVLPATA